MTDNNNTTTAPSNDSFDSKGWDKRKWPFPAPTSSSSTHSGNCHCGAIRFRFTLSPPLQDYPVISCNCSICARKGSLLVYPDRANFVLERPAAEQQEIEGGFDADGETLGGYSFGDAKVRHRFCKRCGSNVFSSLVPGRWEKFWEGLGVEEGVKELVPVNVRMITGLDLDALKLKKVDGWKMGKPEYGLKE